MKKKASLRNLHIFILIMIIGFYAKAQNDTLKKDLHFDPGFARGGQVNIWPVFKKTKSAQQSELQVLFPIFAKKTLFNPREKHTRILPVYFSDSTNNGTDRRILSLYYPSLLRFEKKDTGINQSSSFKFLELAPGISGVQMSRSQGGVAVQNNLFFLLWYKRDSIRQKSHLVFFPLYWHYENSSDTTSILLPITYRYKGADRRQTNIALIYNHSKGHKWSKTSFFPFFYTQKNNTNIDSSRTVLIFPVFLSSKNNRANTQIVFPFYFYHKKPLYQTKTVFPIFSSGHSDNGDRRHLHIFPLYWSSENPHRKSKVFLPFVYYNKKEKKKNLNIFPFYRAVSSDSNRYRKLSLLMLFNHVSTPDYYKTNIYPLVYTGTQMGKTDTLHYSTFIPLFFSKKNKSVDNKILLPLYFQLKNNQYKSTTLIPFYSSGHSPNNSIAHLHIFPFYWSAKKYNAKFKAFVPFYFHLNSPEKKYTTLLPFFSYVTSDSGRSKQFNIYPLYFSVYKQNLKQKVIFPFWWHSISTEAPRDTIFRNTFFPVYFQGNSKQSKYLTIFPLYFSSSVLQKQFQCLFPIYFHHHDKWTQHDIKAFTPFLWKWEDTNDKKHTYLFPLYWSKKIVNGHDTITGRTLFPVFHYSKTSFHENYFVFPLLFRFKNKQYQSLTIFPVFSTGKSKNGQSSYQVITPFIWRNQTPEKKSTVFLPLWWYKTIYRGNDTIHKTALFPIFRHVKSNTTNNLSLFFLYYHNDNPKRNNISIWPFYSQGHRKDTKKDFFSITPLYWHIKKEKISRDFLFPLFWHSVKNKQDKTITNTTVFPFFWKYKEPEKQKTLILPLFYRIKNNDYQSLTVLPFFSGKKSFAKNTSRLFTLPIVWKYKSDQKKRMVIFPLWWDFEDYLENDTLKRKVLFPLLSLNQSKNQTSGRVLPLIYWDKEPGKCSFGLVPLYFSGSNRKSESNYRVFSLLFWKFNSPNRQQTILFPLLWNSKGEGEQNSYVKTTLFPFLWYRQNNERKSIMVFPLTYYSKAPGRERFGLFPLVWHSKGIYHNDTLSTNMITPIYWSFKRDTYRFSFLVPLFLRTSNENIQTSSLFPLFSIGNSHDRKSGFRIITPLAGYLFNPVKKHFYLFPLLNIKKRDSLKTLSILYFLYRHEKSPEYSRTSAILPLIEHYRSEKKKSFRFAPFIWYNQTDSSRMFSFQPFQYSFKSEKRKEFRFLWHLYRNETIKGKSVSRSVLWKVFEHEKELNGEFETRFLYLVYTNIKKDGKREFSVLPFYRKSSNRSGEKNISLFFSFYSYVKRALPDVTDYYEEERLFWIIRVRSNYERLKCEGKEKSIKRRQ